MPVQPFKPKNSLQKNTILIQAKNPQTGKNEWYLDRWSVIFIILMLAVILFFASRKAGFLLGTIGMIAGFVNAFSSGRILSVKNLPIGGGTYCYKSENTGAARLPYLESEYQALNIDGIKISGKPNEVYKTANGTDVTINGCEVLPAGFGSALINNLDNA